MKLYLIVSMSLLLCGCASPRKQIDDISDVDSVSRVVPEKVKFRRVHTDTLLMSRSFDEINGTPLGRVPYITYDSADIYVVDEQMGKVYALDRKSWDYRYTIGTGPGKGPDNLKHAMSIFRDGPDMVVSEHNSMSQYKYFDRNGKYVKSIPNRNQDFQGFITECNLEVSDKYVFKAVSRTLPRKDGKFVLRMKKGDLDRVDREMVRSLDFGIVPDTIRYSSVFMQYIGGKLYVALGNKPIVNSYDEDGKLLQSIELSDIPELATYMSQSVEVNSNSTEHHPSLNFFDYVAYWDNKLILPCAEYDVDKFKANRKAKYVKNFLVMVDLEKHTYAVLKTNEPVRSMRVIDGNLWSYDWGRSIMKIYPLPKEI